MSGADRRQRNRSLTLAQGEIHHGDDRKAAFGWHVHVEVLYFVARCSVVGDGVEFEPHRSPGITAFVNLMYPLLQVAGGGQHGYGGLRVYFEPL